MLEILVYTGDVRGCELGVSSSARLFRLGFIDVSAPVARILI
jgi:hypothetical protein